MSREEYELTLVSGESVLTLQKFSVTGRLGVNLSSGEDDKSYRDVDLSLDQIQIDRFKAWLSNGDPEEISLTSETCAIGLKRNDKRNAVVATDSFGKPKRLETTLSQQQVTKLVAWLHAPEGWPK
jgi:hypothetical protein